MKARGKAGRVVAAAIVNRWVRWLFHQMQPARLAGNEDLARDEEGAREARGVTVRSS